MVKRLPDCALRRLVNDVNGFDTLMSLHHKHFKVFLLCFIALQLQFVDSCRALQSMHLLSHTATLLLILCCHRIANKDRVMYKPTGDLVICWWW